MDKFSLVTFHWPDYSFAYMTYALYKMNQKNGVGFIQKTLWARPCFAVTRRICHESRPPAFRPTFKLSPLTQGQMIKCARAILARCVYAKLFAPSEGQIAPHFLFPLQKLFGPSSVRLVNKHQWAVSWNVFVKMAGEKWPGGGEKRGAGLIPPPRAPSSCPPPSFSWVDNKWTLPIQLTTVLFFCFFFIKLKGRGQAGEVRP